MLINFPCSQDCKSVAIHERVYTAHFYRGLGYMENCFFCMYILNKDAIYL